MAQRKASLGKITRPNVSAVLPRKRLFALLDAQGAAAWVTGPPGCGKTTLAASWLDHAGLRSLWYQLDEGDADVATFFYYLSVAAAARDDGAGEVTNMMTGKGRFQVQYAGEVLTGEATRVSGDERKGIASAYGPSGSFMSCEYQMNTPMQGAGTCNFSNGARYKVHIGN